ncbi:hypothetical protein XMM379_001706 [Aliiroseovarius sp. xm-m-379]|nr:hypothetical protein [Aliiroseovarius sp. xm-d-517]NRP25015.1 hypothetical protein [Aliiroseovarius sp. xm-m-379]NRP31464.1 hypothetical protein [Aliiroseovarius sp. xm-m-314]NRP33814.1 hypothetical protein [Aliiroseovarius sp. xm-a-104]NRP41247.1 hypothetical protein [Aliiroseovarius sp. xm-m-339-2]NRP45302.1 hypothetical protein [Aliiroseovarius sp. xm-m-378]NRP50493.1 hypothetical protein [Aliiroseovarius sp. xm-m-354]NRP62260.1 hypothetical protein [Aliiroseovarius sp. xm-a-151]NRP66
MPLLAVTKLSLGANSTAPQTQPGLFGKTE